jgi:hypothetical protein
MRITGSMLVLGVSGVLSVGLIGAAAQLAPASAAPAIPVRQEACASPFISLTGGTGNYRSMGLTLRVNDGSASRNIVAFKASAPLWKNERLLGIYLAAGRADFLSASASASRAGRAALSACSSWSESWSTHWDTTAAR